MVQLKNDTSIALLMGGPGAEREVSLVSGKAVLEALREAGFTRVTPVIVDAEAPPIPPGTELCYNMIHGTYGEDGGLQSYLEGLGIPFTGAKSTASRLCFNKILSKHELIKNGVCTPRSEVIHAGQRPTFSPPLVIKPPCQGSSVGVEIVHEPQQMDAALREAAKYSDELLVEEYISGKELTVAILDGTPLPVIHICPRTGFYDMHNKYPSMYGGSGTEYICPAVLSDADTAAVQHEALRAYHALGVQVYGRVDVLLPENGLPYVLEINTIPGMTESSLFPKAAAAVGISYRELCRRIAEISLACTG